MSIRRDGNDVAPLHPVAVDIDPITAAVTALARHDATCPECEETLPEFECAARVLLKAGWRRAVREGALRCVSVDHGSAAWQPVSDGGPR